MTYDRGNGAYLGGPNGIRIVAYRLRGDGRHEPIVGHVTRRADGGFEMRTDDGRRFTLRGDANQLASALGRHIWLVARWRAGAMEPLQLGLLGPQR